MPDGIVFVQLKTGYDTDAVPCWITRVRFSVDAFVLGAPLPGRERG